MNHSDKLVMNDPGDVLNAKIITMVCLFGVSMIVGCLPLLISLKFDWFTKTDGPNLRSSNKVVQGLLAFGGGVLFATTFMHLLPEVDDNIVKLQDLGTLPQLPIYLAGLIMCSGFFMMYLIEEIVHMYIKSRTSKNQNPNFSRVLSVRRTSATTSCNNSIEDLTDKEMEASKNQVEISIEEDTAMSTFRGVLIVLALSIHELFEGLAVGLESSAANVWYMFGAVSAHKYIIAFCVGVELLAAGTKPWLNVVYIFVYSFMSALGIGVGILLVGGAGAADEGIYSVVLQGLACGTLLYVVFFEVWKQDSTSMFQFVCSLLGFVVIVILEFIVNVNYLVE